MGEYWNIGGISLPATHAHLTVHRSLYCIFWNLVSALPAHSSTYPSTTWNTVLWMAWVKCMCSWSIAVCGESQTHSYEKYYVRMSLSSASVDLLRRQTAGKLQIKLLGDTCCILDILNYLQTYYVSYIRWHEGKCDLPWGTEMFKSKSKWEIFSPVSMIHISETSSV